MRYTGTEERLLTIEEFQRLPDDGTRLELVRGRVTTYRSRSDIRILGPEDELDAADVVPGFRIGVAELFEG